MTKLTPEQNKQIKTWLKKYGKRSNDTDQMLDDVCYDLNLRGYDKAIAKLIEVWIVNS